MRAKVTMRREPRTAVAALGAVGGAPSQRLLLRVVVLVAWCWRHEGVARLWRRAVGCLVGWLVVGTLVVVVGPLWDRMLVA